MIAGFALGCILLRRYWHRAYKWLLLMMGLNVVVELASDFWSMYTQTSNHWMYNLYWPIQTAVLLLIFYDRAAQRKIKQFHGWLLAALPVSLLACWWKDPELYLINMPAVISGDFLLLLAACGAVADELFSQEHPLLRQPLFWLAFGVVVYGICLIIYYAVWGFIKGDVGSWFFAALYFTGAYMFNIGVAGCFICLYIQGPAANKNVREQAPNKISGSRPLDIK